MIGQSTTRSQTTSERHQPPALAGAPRGKRRRAAPRLAPPWPPVILHHSGPRARTCSQVRASTWCWAALQARACPPCAPVRDARLDLRSGTAPRSCTWMPVRQRCCRCSTPCKRASCRRRRRRRLGRGCWAASPTRRAPCLAPHHGVTFLAHHRGRVLRRGGAHHREAACRRADSTRAAQAGRSLGERWAHALPHLPRAHRRTTAGSPALPLPCLAPSHAIATSACT